MITAKSWAEADDWNYTHIHEKLGIELNWTWSAEKSGTIPKFVFFSFSYFASEKKFRSFSTKQRKNITFYKNEQNEGCRRYWKMERERGETLSGAFPLAVLAFTKYSLNPVYSTNVKWEFKTGIEAELIIKQSKYNKKENV